MSMQDRLDGINKYLRIVDYLIECIHKANTQLSKTAGLYTNTIELTEFGRTKLFIGKFDRLQFSTPGQNYEGTILYVHDEKEKSIPPTKETLGKSIGDGNIYINLDDLVYIACILEKFTEHVTHEIIKNQMNDIQDCIKTLKESAVADLL